MCMRACVRACMRVCVLVCWCVRAYVHACVRACVRVRVCVFSDQPTTAHKYMEDSQQTYQACKIWAGKSARRIAFRTRGRGPISEAIYALTWRACYTFRSIISRGTWLAASSWGSVNTVKARRSLKSWWTRISTFSANTIWSLESLKTSFTWFSLLSNRACSHNYIYPGSQERLRIITSTRVL